MVVGVALMVAATMRVGAQQARVPVAIVRTTATSAESFGAPLNVQALPHGRVLVNDGMRHRVVVLDSMMRVERVVFDSVSGASNAYGARPEPVLAYGDSAIFVDAVSRSFVLITPTGTIGRTAAAPNDPTIWNVAGSSQGLDANGRMFYRGLALRRAGERPTPLNVRMVGFEPGGPISSADSLPLIRGDLETRRVDTIAALRNSQARRTETSTDAKGVDWRTTFVNPFIPGDEWALLSDGTVAIVRGHDYHVDWIAPDGTVSSTGKLPFDWKRLTDDVKSHVRDSVMRVAAETDSIDDARLRAATAGSGNTTVLSRNGVSDPNATPVQIPKRRTIVVPIDSLPDYYPSMRPNAAHGDRDGNLWILPSTSAQSQSGELVYDVVNRRGELTTRVRVPLGRSVAGHAASGVVFLLNGDLTRGFTIERARIEPAR